MMSPTKRPSFIVQSAVLALCVGLCSSALAQSDRECPEGATFCSRSAAALFEASGCGDMAGYSYDSGWLPDDTNEIQVRFRLQLGGLVDDELSAAGVAMESEALATWPPPVEASLSGADDGGVLSVGYGINIQAQIRVEFEWEGISIRETFDVPIPYVGDIGDRLNMEGQTTFMPVSLGETQIARGETDRFTLFEYDVLGAILEPIDVIVDELEFEGGFRLDLLGSTEARYRTDRVLSSLGSPLTPERPTATFPNPGGDGYGASLPSFSLEPEGTFECEVELQLIPTLFIGIFDYELTWDIPIDISIGLDDTRTSADFDPQDFILGLPDVAVEPEVLDFGTHPGGAIAEEIITVHNIGGAQLLVDLTAMTPAISVTPEELRLSPEGFAYVIVNADPDQLDPESAGILLETSDPDTPRLTVGVLGSPIDLPDAGPDDPDGGPDDPDAGPDDPDAGPDDPDGGDVGDGTELAAGCDCRAAARPSGALPLALVLLGARPASNPR